MEKVPKKKARKGLKKRFVALILLAAALTAGTGVLFLRRAEAPVLPETPKKAVLLDRPAEDIASVTIETAQGAAYTLIRQEDTFRLRGQEKTDRKSVV